MYKALCDVQLCLTLSLRRFLCLCWDADGETKWSGCRASLKASPPGVLPVPVAHPRVFAVPFGRNGFCQQRPTFAHLTLSGTGAVFQNVFVFQRWLFSGKELRVSCCAIHATSLHFAVVETFLFSPLAKEH